MMTLGQTYTKAVELFERGKISPASFIGIMDCEVVAVVHAHWVEAYENIKCSECSAEYSDEIVFMNRDFKVEALKYCPCCGAKMDEEVE